MWLKTLYRKRAVTWPFIFYTIIWTLSFIERCLRQFIDKKKNNISDKMSLWSYTIQRVTFCHYQSIIGRKNKCF
ncbi:hypothetical protein CYQ56_08490 [Enterococcus faecium]|nr:hypothetical protein CYQ56_08490 [Enterococcus faecium]